MRVLIVQTRMRIYGGAELLIVRLCNHLTRRGHTATLLTTGMIPEVARDLEATEVVVAAAGDDAAGLGGRAHVQRELEVLRKGVAELSGRADVVNVHNFPAEVTADACARPVVWMCNEPELYLHATRCAKTLSGLRTMLFYRGFLRREKRIVAEHVRAAVCADELNAARFARIYGRDPVVIHYGIDHDFFSREPDGPSALPFDRAGRFVILQVGMLTPYKNQAASIKALARFVRRAPEALLVLAGSAPRKRYREKLEALVRRHALERNVVFTGHIDRYALRQLYASADVLLHPIRPQGGWLSPFEALCAGKPIIVSKEMTARSLIEREGIGIVTDDYVAALDSVRTDPVRHAVMAARGRAFVQAHLSWDAFCDGMLRTFEAVLAPVGEKSVQSESRESGPTALERQ